MGTPHADFPQAQEARRCHLGVGHGRAAGPERDGNSAPSRRRTLDTVNGKPTVADIYVLGDPRYTGRASVPVLWDKKRSVVVNNESSEIIRMLNSAFDAFTDVRTDYYPAALRGEIDSINQRIYETVNNGVYRSGFATTQAAYEHAARALFETLDYLEERLSRQRYLVGRQITEADWRLFTTLVRFDAVYYSHFKCNLRRIIDYPNLGNYLRDLYQVPGVAETVSLDHIKRHYYGSHRNVNPTGIVPIGPLLDFTRPTIARVLADRQGTKKALRQCGAAPVFGSGNAQRQKPQATRFNGKPPQGP